MKWSSAIWILLAQISLAWAGEASKLHDIQAVETLDSIQLNLNFTGDLPEKYRVFALKDSLGNTALMLAFLGAEFDTTDFAKSHPKWLAAESLQDHGANVVRIHVRLNRNVPYRGEWKGNTFQLMLANAVDKSKSLWKEPWLYVGLGAATVGGAVLWMSVGSSTSSNQDIPPPDIKLPK